MNDRHNRIAGCQAAVDAARVQWDIAARRVAEGAITWQDSEDSTDYGDFTVVNRYLNDYRAAQEAYASALDDLADAVRR